MLDDVQKKLEARFAGLKEARAARRHPTYAIEHALSDQERASTWLALANALRLNHGPHNDHWLLWVTAAAEIGYGYDGDEYWRSFSAQFPAWEIGWRGFVRHWYGRFVRTYNGVSPQGAWASHFGIIAYPIAHAIVPRYLQRLFLQHLSDLRFELSGSGFKSPSEIGKLLDDRYSGGFRRFAQFLEQHDLTGRLVLALRDQDAPETVPRIAPETLARIVGDIESLPRGEILLQRVRRALRDARVSATSLIGRRDAPAANASNALRQRQAGLIGRRLEDGTWSVRISVPNFEETLKSTEIAQTLSKVRFRLADAPGWRPGGALRSLALGFEHPIREVQGKHPLVELIPRNQALESALAPITTIPSKPPWLLHCREDIARLVLTNVVRPEQSYLLIAAPSPADSIATLGMERVQSIQISDLTAYSFTLPKQLKGTHVDALRKIGLGHALQVKVSSVGLTPRLQSLDDASVWLTTEQPILRLAADCAVTEYLIAIGAYRVRVPAGTGNVIVSLGTLPEGRYEVEIGAVSAVSGVKVVPQTLQFLVVPPQAWTAAVPSRAGVKILTAPSDATIDDLLDGRSDVEVRGPEGRNATLSAELFADNGSLIQTNAFMTARLPFAAKHVRSGLQRLQTIQWSEAIAAAARIDISVSVDELGRDTLSFPHSIDAVRWKLEHRTGKWFARLIDESGVLTELKVMAYPMETPLLAARQDSNAAFEGIEISPPGALMVAQAGPGRHAVVMSVHGAQSVAAFSDLLPKCVFAPTTRGGVDYLRRLLSSRRLWGRATLRGHLASARREHVRKAVFNEIAIQSCGAIWAERWSRGMSGDATVVGDLRKHLKGSPGFGYAMQNTSWRWQHNDKAAVETFIRIAKQYEVESNEVVCQDAMLLAFDPDRFRWKEKTQVLDRLQLVVSNRRLTRGAFLAAVSDSLAGGAGGR